MSTIKVKSTEFVRKFSDIKSLILETGTRVIIEDYKDPVLVVYPCDEDGDPIPNKAPDDISEMEKLKKKLDKRKITVSTVNFV